MKSYTDLEQSKKLAEFLPLESADMCYIKDKPNIGFLQEEYKEFGDTILQDYYPCWSLAALLDLLPNNEHIETNISRGSWKIDTVEYVSNTWWCEYEDNKNQTEFNVSADNPVDACVNMILKLKEKNLL